MGRNGKIRPRHAQVDDQQVEYPEGHYELRQYVDRKTIYRNVGDDAALALAELHHETKRQILRDAAVDVGVVIPDAPGRVALKARAEVYRLRQLSRGKKRSAVTFKAAVDEFLTAVGVPYADQLREEHILHWYDVLRARRNAERTIYNKHVSVFGFLKWAGIDTKRLARKAPTFTEAEVEIYKPDELAKFFASIRTSYQRIVFDVLLKTGTRMQEAMFLEWRDFNLTEGTLTVSAKDDMGFDIKDRAGRTVPIPADLIEHLREWKKTHTGRLVLGTVNDTPNWKLLQMLKRCVRRAGLNCGVCRACREHGECERWYLHKFRATYTTKLLRSGIDVRTVMLYTGHEDMNVVLRYLSVAEGEETQNKINSIVWTTPIVIA
jgi:integrase